MIDTYVTRALFDDFIKYEYKTICGVQYVLCELVSMYICIVGGYDDGGLIVSSLFDVCGMWKYHY